MKCEENNCSRIVRGVLVEKIVERIVECLVGGLAKRTFEIGKRELLLSNAWKRKLLKEYLLLRDLVCYEVVSCFRTRRLLLRTPQQNSQQFTLSHLYLS